MPLSDLIASARGQLGPEDAELRIWLMVVGKNEKLLKRMAVWVPKGGIVRGYTLH